MATIKHFGYVELFRVALGLIYSFTTKQMDHNPRAHFTTHVTPNVRTMP